MGRIQQGMFRMFGGPFRPQTAHAGPSGPYESLSLRFSALDVTHETSVAHLGPIFDHFLRLTLIFRDVWGSVWARNVKLTNPLVDFGAPEGRLFWRMFYSDDRVRGALRRVPGWLENRVTGGLQSSR